MKLKYIGKGNFLPGVPGRDLIEVEAEECGGAKTLVASGLYEAEKPAVKVDKAAAKTADKDGD